MATNRGDRWVSSGSRFGWWLVAAIALLAGSRTIGPVQAGEARETTPAAGKEDSSSFFKTVKALILGDSSETATTSDEAATITVRSAPADAAGEVEVVEEEKSPTIADATHRQSTVVTVKGQESPNWTLVAFCALADGRLIAAVGPNARYGAVAADGDDSQKASKHGGELQVLDAEGKRITTWPLAFAPQTVNVGPDGSIFVGGSGKLAHFNAEGGLLKCVDSPHVTEALKDTDGIRAQAEEQLKQQEAMANQLKPMLEQFEKQLAELEKKKSEAKIPTVIIDGQIASVKETIKAYEQAMTRPRKQMSIESVMDSIKARLVGIHSLAVSDQDVFVVTASTQGYGYVVWRMTHEFTEPTQIGESLSGCCGQMEIQCHDGCVYAAENSRHRVVRFDRDGKKLGSFGKRDRKAAGAGFGSCCNPMNVRFSSSGDLFTSESNGMVKRFTPDGKFVESVGVAKVRPGCKSSIIALSPDMKRVYYFDSEHSTIVMLDRTAESQPAAGDQAAGN